MKTISLDQGLTLLRICTVSIVLGLCIFLFGSTQHAQAATGLTIQPVKASYTISPGKSISGAILLTNSSDNDAAVSLKAEDFIPTAGTNSIQFVGRAAGVSTVRDWIKIEGPSSFTFSKGQSKVIKYTITAPENAEPGSHFGVIFFKATDADGAEQQLKVGTQVGVLVFVTVPGNFNRSGKILDFKAPAFLENPPVTFTMRYENTGTVHYEPKGTIEIRNLFGKVVGAVPVEGQVVLPTGIKDIAINWEPTGFTLGRYLAKVTINDADGNPVETAQTSFYVVPVKYIIAFVVAVILVYLILRFVRRRLKISVSLK